MVNVNWTRWIAASINKHFAKSETTVDSFVEGEEWNVIDAKQSFAEIRINGPRYTDYHNFVAIELNINIMASALMLGNIYEIQRLSGIFAARMSVPILIKKYGNQVGDDSALIGCLLPKDDVDTVIFGQSSADKRITLVSIERLFQAEL